MRFSRVAMALTFTMLFTCGPSDCAVVNIAVSSCMDQALADGCSGCEDCTSCDCSCESCGCEIEPIPGGFPPEARIDSSLQLRLTDTGMEFVETELVDAVAENVPRIPMEETNLREAADGSVLVPDVTLCVEPNVCHTELFVQDITFEALADGAVQVGAVVRVLATNDEDVNGGIGWPSENNGDSCLFTYDTAAAPGGGETLNVSLALELPPETIGPRVDYDRLQIVPGSIALSGIHPDDQSGCGFDAFDGDLAEDVVEAIQCELEDRLPELVEEMMCDPSADGCPEGSVPEDGVCTIPETDGACVQKLLGMEGRTDVAGALGEVGLGLEAFVDFLFAATDGSRTPNSGFNVDLGLGLEPLSEAECITVGEAPALPSLPTLDVLGQNLHPNGRGVDIGVGVSESAINRTLWGLWAAGTLCLDVGTGLDQQLSGNTFAALFIRNNTLSRTVFPTNPAEAAVGLRLRPAAPPVFTVGDVGADEDLITIELDQLDIDFYVFAADRYLRMMTIRTNVRVGVNLSVEDNVVTPTVDTVELTGTTIENGELVVDDTENVVSQIESLAGAIAGGLAGAIPPVPVDDLLAESELSSQLPLPIGIELANDSFVRLEQDDEAFLGVFLDLALAPPGSALAGRPDASVEVTQVTLPEDREGFSLKHFAEGPSPRVEIAMSANAPLGQEIEYAYRLGFGPWSEWTRSNYAIVEHPSLFLQQSHRVEVVARIAGDPHSVDREPAVAHFTIDATAPSVELFEQGGEVWARAFDLTSPPDTLSYRTIVDGVEGEALPWPSDGDDVLLGSASESLAVEVKDAHGNVGRAEHGLRGLPDPDAAGGGCDGCAAVSGDGASPGALSLLFGLGLALLLRRRGRRRG